VTRSVNGNKKDSVAIQFQSGKNHFWETESWPGFSDDFLKSPDTALRGILRHCSVPKSTLHSSGFVRLVCELLPKSSKCDRKTTGRKMLPVPVILFHASETLRS
jgi:hypothetical protein